MAPYTILEVMAGSLNVDHEGVKSSSLLYGNRD